MDSRPGLILGSYAKHWLQSEPWPSDSPRSLKLSESATPRIGRMTDVVLVVAVLEFMMSSVSLVLCESSMRMQCKESLQCSSSVKQKYFQRLLLNNKPTQEESNITLTRRARLHVLLQEFVQTQAAQGVPPKGLEQSFAAVLQVGPSLLSQIKKSRPISDKLARQIEAACHVPIGWLDQPVENTGPDPAEEAFVELARRAWRAANAKQKRELRTMMKTFGTGYADAEAK